MRAFHQFITAAQTHTHTFTYLNTYTHLHTHTLLHTDTPHLHRHSYQRKERKVEGNERNEEGKKRTDSRFQKRKRDAREIRGKGKRCPYSLSRVLIASSLASDEDADDEDDDDEYDGSRGVSQDLICLYKLVD